MLRERIDGGFIVFVLLGLCCMSATAQESRELADEEEPVAEEWMGEAAVPQSLADNDDGLDGTIEART